MAKDLRREERNWKSTLLLRSLLTYIHGIAHQMKETHGKETKNERKVRIHGIERRWAREWREYRYVTPKYMKKFSLHPPCPRPPLAPGQVADPTSLKRNEDYPDEWVITHKYRGSIVASFDK